MPTSVRLCATDRGAGSDGLVTLEPSWRGLGISSSPSIWKILSQTTRGEPYFPPPNSTEIGTPEEAPPLLLRNLKSNTGGREQPSMKRLPARHSLTREIKFLSQRKNFYHVSGQIFSLSRHTYTQRDKLELMHFPPFTHTFSPTGTHIHIPRLSLSHTHTHTNDQAFKPKTEGGYEKVGVCKLSCQCRSSNPGQKAMQTKLCLLLQLMI